MKIKTIIRSTFRFIKDFCKYPYDFPHFIWDEIKFDDFNHEHICIARLFGSSVYEQVCPYNGNVAFCGTDDVCDFCKYNARADFIGDSNGKRLNLCCSPKIIELFEWNKPEALKKAESILPPIEEMRYLTEEERAEFNKHLEEISTPIIGVDGKPVNINDVI